jgi:thiosulfate/3-mercaptopyruvate sulfurtransferase
MSGYANPEVLVSTDWVKDHLEDPDLVVVEVDEDVLLYETGHIAGARKIDWQADFWQNEIRDFVTPAEFAALMGRLGIARDTTVVLYGDKSNWWAAYAFWLFKYHGHPDVRLMNGGRQKWLAEERLLTREVPQYSPTQYPVPFRDETVRSYREDVLRHLVAVVEGHGALVDVRSPGEYSGVLTHMHEYTQEGVLRGGHIPGAVNIPWSQAVEPDGTFKSFEQLQELYASKGVTAEREVVVYCRIAESSSHTWFVLRYLLGYPLVSNYDGSWTEWGNSVRLPIRKGES